MHNSPFPYNQNEHIFDFKVKVNFQNGNISLTAPQIVTPPATFNPTCNPKIGVPFNPTYTAHSYVNINSYRVGMQRPNSQNLQQFELQKLVYPFYGQKQVNNNSFKSQQFGLNESIEVIECAMCMKSFSLKQFDTHLELHRQRGGKSSLSNNQQEFTPAKQENSSNGIMVTQNSFNQGNDSYFSENLHPNGNSEYSFKHNESQMSHNSSQKNIIQFNRVENVPRTMNLPPTILNQEKIKKIRYNQNNQSLHFLGQIENPILLLRANKESFTSQQNNNSLDYSDSSEHPRFDHRISNSNNNIVNQLNLQKKNSFRNEFVGPSFSHSKGQSFSLERNFITPPNQIKYHKFQQIHHPYQLNSFNNNSQQFINNSISNISLYSQSSNLPHHQISRYSSQNMNNRSLPEHGNYLLQQFQPIQSRCTVEHINYNGVRPQKNLHNNVSMDQNIYSSHHEMAVQKTIKGTKSERNQFFVPDDSISSISSNSRISMTQCSDFEQINNNMKATENNIQAKSTQKNSNQEKVGFFKNKKDKMISSTTSYYDRKFKDNQSSSEEEKTNLKDQRLSYADRLKQKKLSDAQKADNFYCKSLSSTKNLKKQERMGLSKISETSNQSKTKLPVNYLAREDFISTSSKTSKSTHKSTVNNS